MKLNMYLWLKLFLLTVILHRVKCVCNLGPPYTTFGEQDSLEFGEGQYLMLSQGIITCAGVISQWEIGQPGGGAPCDEIHFHVWRPQATTHQYAYVGGNDITVSQFSACTNAACAPMSLFCGVSLVFDILPADQIPVQSGDIIGWSESRVSTLNRSEVTYDTMASTVGASERVVVRDLGAECGGAVAGTVCDWTDDWWGGPHTRIVRDIFVRPGISFTSPKPILLDLGNSCADVFTPVTTIPYNNQPGDVVYIVNTVNIYEDRNVIQPEIALSLTGDCGGGCSADYVIDPNTGVITVINHVTANCILKVDGLFTVTGSSVSGYIRVAIDPVEVEDGQFSFTNLPDSVPPLNAQIVNVNDLLWTVGVSGNPIPAVAYHIVYTEPINAPFVLDATNDDEVRLTRDLREWTGPTTYTLYIMATNGFYSCGPSALVITINNIWPRLPPYITNLEAVVTLAELTTGPVDIYTVIGSGVDSGVGADTRGYPFTYTINKVYPRNADPTDFNIIKNSDTNAAVRYIAGTALDYFGMGKFHVEVIITDVDSLNSDPKNLTLEVTWVNSLPVCASNSFTTSISEDLMGDTGLQLTCSDRDSPLGDWLEFTIQSVANLNNFIIDNSTQRLQVINPLSLPPNTLSLTDQLTVHVFDSFNRNTFVTVIIDITVLDVNDHRPEFTKLNYSGSVTEGAAGSTAVGVQLVWADSDGGLNGQVTFMVVETDARLYFQVDSAGQVTMKQPLQWLMHPNMTFHVVVEDAGSPRLTSSQTATVFVEVLPINSHNPQCTPATQRSVVRSASSGQEVATLGYIDLDPALVSHPTFYILNIQSEFTVDSNTGSVSTLRPLAPQTQYLLHVNVRDNGTPQELFSDPCTLELLVYNAAKTLVDIYLDVQLVDFLETEDEFLEELGDQLQPWVPYVESVHLKKEKTVVTIYALVSNNLTAYDEDIFVNQDELLHALRMDIDGTPRTWLTGPPFAPWQPYHVQPTDQQWATDTRGGQATLAICCLLLAAAGTISTFILWRKKKLCFKLGRPKSARIAPQKQTTNSDRLVKFSNDEFNLHYPGQSNAAKSKVPSTNPILPASPPLTKAVHRGPMPPERAPVNQGPGAPPLKQQVPQQESITSNTYNRPPPKAAAVDSVFFTPKSA